MSRDWYNYGQPVTKPPVYEEHEHMCYECSIPWQCNQDDISDEPMICFVCEVEVYGDVAECGECVDVQGDCGRHG